MDELYISDLWMAALGGQLTLFLTFVALIFRTGTTKKEIDRAKQIVNKHSHSDYILHLMECTNECDHQLGMDSSKISQKHFRILGIGAIVMLVTFILAAYLGNINRTTKRINSELSSYHQQMEVLTISPYDWDNELKKSTATQKVHQSTIDTITLPLNQEEIKKYRQLIFAENYPWIFEAVLIMILVSLTGLPFLWALRIKRRVLRNSAYIAASYSYAASQVLTDKIKKSATEFRDELNTCLDCVDNRIDEHKNDCVGFRNNQDQRLNS